MLTLQAAYRSTSATHGLGHGFFLWIELFHGHPLVQIGQVSRARRQIKLLDLHFPERQGLNQGAHGTVQLTPLCPRRMPTIEPMLPLLDAGIGA